MMWRQGDVLIEKLETLDLQSLNKSEERLLVRGEGRYHGHFIMGEVSIYPNDDFNPENTVSHFLEVRSEAVLKHLHTETGAPTGEHGDLNIKPGLYRVIRQREYNPYAKIIEIIRD